LVLNVVDFPAASELEGVRKKGGHPEHGMVEMGTPRSLTTEITEPKTQVQ
jgi:hypothetical protein